MMQTKVHIALCVTCLIAGILLGAGFRSCSKQPEVKPEPITLHDTLTIHDTLRIEKHTKPREVIRWDTLVIRDTDTIRIEIPIEKKEYRDTFKTDGSRVELGVFFEGYKAKIDSIDLKTQYTLTPQPIVIEKKGWGQFVGIGIGVGYGASFVGNPSGVGTIVHAAPEIGVHITYGWGYHW